MNCPLAAHNLGEAFGEFLDRHDKIDEPCRNGVLWHHRIFGSGELAARLPREQCSVTYERTLMAPREADPEFEAQRDRIQNARQAPEAYPRLLRGDRLKEAIDFTVKLEEHPTFLAVVSPPAAGLAAFASCHRGHAVAAAIRSPMTKRWRHENAPSLHSRRGAPFDRRSKTSAITF